MYMSMQEILSKSNSEHSFEDLYRYMLLLFLDLNVQVFLL